MKKMYLGILTVVAISGLVSSQAWAVGKYLHNNYGAQIQYVHTTPAMAASQPTNYPAATIGNGKQVQVGRDSPHLSIRTVGGSYYDISYLFKQINDEQKNHGSDDAIIYILPRSGFYGIYGWNIKISWEKLIIKSTIRK